MHTIWNNGNSLLRALRTKISSGEGAYGEEKLPHTSPRHRFFCTHTITGIDKTNEMTQSKIVTSLRRSAGENVMAKRPEER